MIRMYHISVFFLLFLFIAPSSLYGAEKHLEVGSFYDLDAQLINGKKVDFSEYRGKVVMVVNTASKCGFTPQYTDLQKLYEKYVDQDFLILGFPSNDFAEAELGSNKEIKKFCKLKYGITFPIFERNPVRGDKKQPVYQFLTQQCKDDFQGEVDWNFEKFLIGKDGTVRIRYGSFTNPLNVHVLEKIEELLSEQDSQHT